MFKYLKRIFTSSHAQCVSPNCISTTEFHRQALNTLHNQQWYIENKGCLLLLFPEVFTHEDNIDTVFIVNKLKEIGHVIRTEEEFGFTMRRLHGKKVFINDKQNNRLIKRNLDSNLKWN